MNEIGMLRQQPIRLRQPRSAKPSRHRGKYEGNELPGLAEHIRGRSKSGLELMKTAEGRTAALRSLRARLRCLRVRQS